MESSEVQAADESVENANEEEEEVMTWNNSV